MFYGRLFLSTIVARTERWPICVYLGGRSRCPAKLYYPMEAGSLVHLGHSARSPLLVFIRTMGTESDKTTVATDVAEAGSRESTCLGAMGEFCHLISII